MRDQERRDALYELEVLAQVIEQWQRRRTFPWPEGLLDMMVGRGLKLGEQLWGEQS